MAWKSDSPDFPTSADAYQGRPNVLERDGQVITVKFCPGCGIKSSPAYKYCPDCGRSLKRSDNLRKDQCHKCRTLLEDNDKNCYNCGAVR